MKYSRVSIIWPPVTRSIYYPNRDLLGSNLLLSRINFRKAQTSYFFEIAYSRVFWCADYENDIEDYSIFTVKIIKNL